MNICLNCGTETKNPKFCSSSCSATFNNLKAGRKKPLGNCLNCGIKIGVKGWRSSRRKYCSNKCGIEYRSKMYIENWLSGKESGSKEKDKTSCSAFVRNYLLKINNYKCSKCGWGEVNEFTKTIPLEVHHKNGDFLNNIPENLEVLCPNCHSLTNSQLNRGRGRRVYEKTRL